MNQQAYINSQLLKFVAWMNDSKSKFLIRDLSSTPSFFSKLYCRCSQSGLSFFSYDKEIEIYRKICKSKVFSFTDEEVLENEFFNSDYINIPYGEGDLDLGSCYDELIHDVGFALLNFNSTAVIGLFHLFEKGCRSFVEAELCSLWFRDIRLKDDNKKIISLIDLDNNLERWDLWLKIFLNIDIYGDFKNILKLKLSANYLKHGNGASERKLRKNFIELFEPNDEELEKVILCAPISQDHTDYIYVDFNELADECLRFWSKIKNYKEVCISSNLEDF